MGVAFIGISGYTWSLMGPCRTLKEPRILFFGSGYRVAGRGNLESRGSGLAGRERREIDKAC